MACAGIQSAGALSASVSTGRTSIHACAFRAVRMPAIGRTSGMRPSEAKMTGLVVERGDRAIDDPGTG